MKVLMLGAGAVGTVSALKFVQEAMLEKLVIADAVSARASLLADRLNDPRVSALVLDAGDRAAVARTIRETGVTIVLNAALPATNIEVMRACLEAGCDYIDLASGGTDADGIPKLEDQFALDAEFRAAGRLALLGMGADPGTTNVYAAYAAKHLLDTVTEIRVRDGDNSVCQGHDGFIAAFSPWVFIDECLCKAVSWRDGRYHLEEPLTRLRAVRFSRARHPQLLLRGSRGVEDPAPLLPAGPDRGFQALHGRRDGGDAAGHEATGTLEQGPGPGGRRLDRTTRPGGLPAASAQGPGRPDAGQDLRRHPGQGHEERASHGPTTSTMSRTTRRPMPSSGCRPRRTRPGIPPVIAARLIARASGGGPASCRPSSSIPTRSSSAWPARACPGTSGTTPPDGIPGASAVSRETVAAA